MENISIRTKCKNKGTQADCKSDPDCNFNKYGIVAGGEDRGCEEDD
jgi:hypothetical protein